MQVNSPFRCLAAVRTSQGLPRSGESMTVSAKAATYWKGELTCIGQNRTNENHHFMKNKIKVLSYQKTFWHLVRVNKKENMFVDPERAAHGVGNNPEWNHPPLHVQSEEGEIISVLFPKRKAARDAANGTSPGPYNPFFPKQRLRWRALYNMQLIQLN